MKERDDIAQTASSDAVTILNELIETSKDGEKGFALAANDSEESSLTEVFRKGEKSCRVAVEALQAQVRAMRASPENDGSMKAAVHRGWISLKSVTSSRSTLAILEECEKGEDYAKAKYREALMGNLPAAARELVERQYQGVVANHDRIRDLRNQYRT